MAGNDMSRINPGVLHQKAKEVIKIRTELDGSLKNFGKIITVLDETWDDDAQKEVSAKYMELKSTMDDFLTLIENYSKIMDQRATDEEEAVKRAVSLAKKFL